MMKCTQVFSTNKTVRHDITEKIVESGINIDSPFSHYLINGVGYGAFSHYYGALTPLNHWWKNL
jgi:hypothetical protein